MTELQANIWLRLSTRTRRALLRRKGRWGRIYAYRPRGDLLVNLQREFGITIDQARLELLAIRELQLGNVENH